MNDSFIDPASVGSIRPLSSGSADRMSSAGRPAPGRDQADRSGNSAGPGDS
jgi:hypothetical protein